MDKICSARSHVCINLSCISKYGSDLQGNFCDLKQNTGCGLCLREGMELDICSTHVLLKQYNCPESRNVSFITLRLT